MARYVTILLAFAAIVCAVKDKPKAEHKHVWMSTFIQQFAVPAEDSHENAQRLYEFNQRCDAHPVRAPPCVYCAL
jgi:hypothetical protein